MSRHPMIRRRLENRNVTFVGPQSPPPKPTLDETHPIGVEFRITSNAYGASYERVKGTVVGYEAGKVALKVAKRKTPLIVEVSHLEAVKAKAA